MPVTILANIIEILSISIPYVSQSITPTNITIYIESDNSFTDLVFQVLRTCGRYAMVVKTPAINPTISILNVINQQYLQFYQALQLPF